MTLPSVRDYPEEIKGTTARACARSRCFKCKKPTRVEYVRATDGRAWPTCLDCATAAGRAPCPECSYTGPTTHAMEPLPERGHRRVLHHDNGVSCYPHEAHETHAVRCSSCGGELHLEVTAVMAIIHSMPDGIVCACGAAWKLESIARPGIHVYVRRAA